MEQNEEFSENKKLHIRGYCIFAIWNSLGLFGAEFATLFSEIMFLCYDWEKIGSIIFHSKTNSY